MSFTHSHLPGAFGTQDSGSTCYIRQDAPVERPNLVGPMLACSGMSIAQLRYFCWRLPFICLTQRWERCDSNKPSGWVSIPRPRALQARALPIELPEEKQDQRSRPLDYSTRSFMETCVFTYPGTADFTLRHYTGLVTSGNLSIRDARDERAFQAFINACVLLRRPPINLRSILLDSNRGLALIPLPLCG